MSAQAGASWLGGWRWRPQQAAGVAARLERRLGVAAEDGAVWLALGEARLLAGDVAGAGQALERAVDGPRRRALRGVLQLRGYNDAQGVVALLAAAEENPALLALAVEEIGAWLDGPGRAHDSATLRAELVRLTMAYEKGAAEHGDIGGREDYCCERLEGELLPQLRSVLARHAEVLRHAWVARRMCRTAAKWRHVDVILDVHPRQWLGRGQPRQLAQEMARRILGELLEVVDGEATLHVRATPDEVPLWLMQRLREQGDDVLAPPREQHPQREEKPRSEEKVVAPRRRRLGKGAVAAFSLGVPALIGAVAVQAYVDNDATHEAVAKLAQQHRHKTGKRHWRQPRLEDFRSPVRILQLFKAARLAEDALADLPIYTRATRQRLKRRPLARARLKLEARLQAACGAARIRILGERAVAWYPRDVAHCLPVFLKREEERWRVDHAAMMEHLLLAADGRWRLRGQAAGYRFAFPLPGQGAAQAALRKEGFSASRS